MCTLNFYFPNVDYCCCSTGEQVRRTKRDVSEFLSEIFQKEWSIKLGANKKLYTTSVIAFFQEALRSHKLSFWFVETFRIGQLWHGPILCFCHGGLSQSRFHWRKIPLLSSTLLFSRSFVADTVRIVTTGFGVDWTKTSLALRKFLCGLTKSFMSLKFAPFLASAFGQCIPSGRACLQELRMQLHSTPTMISDSGTSEYHGWFRCKKKKKALCCLPALWEQVIWLLAFFLLPSPEGDRDFLLKILLPIILVPIVLVALSVACCVYCLRRRGHLSNGKYRDSLEDFLLFPFPTYITALLKKQSICWLFFPLFNEKWKPVIFAKICFHCFFSDGPLHCEEELEAMQEVSNLLSSNPEDKVNTDSAPGLVCSVFCFLKRTCCNSRETDRRRSCPLPTFWSETGSSHQHLRVTEHTGPQMGHYRKTMQPLLHYTMYTGLLMVAQVFCVLTMEPETRGTLQKLILAINALFVLPNRRPIPSHYRTLLCLDARGVSHSTSEQMRPWPFVKSASESGKHRSVFPFTIGLLYISTILDRSTEHIVGRQEISKKRLPFVTHAGLTVCYRNCRPCIRTEECEFDTDFCIKNDQMSPCVIKESQFLWFLPSTISISTQTSIDAFLLENKKHCQRKKQGRCASTPGFFSSKKSLKKNGWP